MLAMRIHLALYTRTQKVDFDFHIGSGRAFCPKGGIFRLTYLFGRECYSYDLLQKKHYVYNVGVYKIVCYVDKWLLRNASLNFFYEKMLKIIYQETKHFFQRWSNKNKNVDKW